MPAIQGSNEIAAKMAKQGLGKLFAGHAKDETIYGSGGELPPNINGVAELRGMKLDQYKTGPNEGDFFASIYGVVKTPKEHEGKRVSRMIGLTDDPSNWKNARSKDDKTKELMNELRKLGGETCTHSVGSPKDVIDVMEAIVASGVHFLYHTFATSAPKDATEKEKKEFKPRTVHVIDRAAHNFIEGEDQPVVDETAKSNGETHKEQSTGSVEDNEWMQLAAQANEQNREAQLKLTKACTEHGIDADGADSWEAAAEQLIAAIEGGEGKEPEVEAAGEWKPEKGQTYDYKAPGKGQKSEPCEVTAVFSETVNLKRKRDGSVFKGVSWGTSPDNIGGQEV